MRTIALHDTSRRTRWRAVTRTRSTSTALLGAMVLGLIGASATAQDSPAPPGPLTLGDVVAVARGERPEVRAASSLAEAAEQQPRIVRRPADPVVFASLDHLPTTFHGADFSAGVQLSTPLGRVLRNRRRAADAQASARRIDVERVALDAELEAVVAFFELRYARAIGGVFAHQAELIDELVAGASARYEAGMGAQSDVLRAEAERARIEASIRSVAGLVESAEGMFNAALGRVSGTAIPELADPVFDAPPSLAAALRESLAIRPELDSQRAFITRAAAEIDVMRGMFRPMLMVQAGGAYTMSDGPGLMAMVGFSVPIWRDRLRAGVSEARAMRAMEESELEAMLRMVEGEIAGAHGDVLAADARASTLRDEVLPLARQAADANLAQYAAARVPLVSPIEASRTLFMLESETLMAEMERGIARARLGRAMGRSADAW